VTSYVTYYDGNYLLYTTINGTSTENTPLMISQNIHWNLDGFANPETNSALTHSLNLPFSGLRIEVNDNLVPTGAIISNAPGSSNDFWTKFRQIGSGYDTAFLISREQFGPSTFLPLADGGLWWEASPVASLRSNWSGLQVDIYTDQDGIQLNACNSQDGKLQIPTPSDH
jgi:galactose mutarotase-like enzyme